MSKFSIFHFPFSISKTHHCRGFTLLELLVSVSILVTVGAIGLSMLVIILRGSTKADRILIVKQNGNFALTQMVRQIRYAKSLDAPASCVPAVTLNPPSLTITSSFDNGQTTYTCSNNTISSNSATLIDTSNLSIPSASCTFTCSQANASSQPTIGIKFLIQTKNQASFFESVVSIPFESAVTMRNAGQ